MSESPFDLDLANARIENLFAPVVQGLNPRIDRIAEDEVVMRLPYSDDLCRIGGIVCGQAMMTLIDTCMVYVCYIGLKRFAEVTTVTQTTNFMRPAVQADLIARGRPVKAGRTLVFGEVTVYVDGDDRPVCNATSTYAVLPDR